MEKLKGLKAFVLIGMVFLCTVPDSTAGQPCPTLTMTKEIPYQLVYPTDPADQVVARGTCRTYTIKPTLQGENGPVTVRIEGQGFSLSGGTNPQEVQVGANREITICSDETACGSGLLFIGATEIGSIRSDVGTWVLISENQCVISEDPDGPVSSYIPHRTHYRISVEKIRGKGRQGEVISRYYREPHVECACGGFNGSDLGGRCDMSLELNSEGKRCLGATVMPYGGTYPCAEGYYEPFPHWSWCGCIAGMSYHEWRCSQ